MASPKKQRPSAPSPAEPTPELHLAVRAVEHFRQLSLEHPEHLPTLAAYLDVLGMSLWQQGRAEEGRAKLEEAQGVYRRIVPSSPEQHAPPLARSLGALGSMRTQSGDHSGAMSAFQEAFQVLLPVARQNPAAHQVLLSALVRDCLQTAKAGKVSVDSATIAEVLRLL